MPTSIATSYAFVVEIGGQWKRRAFHDFRRLPALRIGLPLTRPLGGRWHVGQTWLPDRGPPSLQHGFYTRRCLQ